MYEHLFHQISDINPNNIHIPDGELAEVGDIFR